MNRKLRIFLLLLLAVLFLTSTVLLVRALWDYRRAQQTNEEAQALVSQTKPPAGPTAPPETEPAETLSAQTEPPELVWVPAPIPEEDPHLAQLRELNLTALQEVNPDVLGWIFIPDSCINYPILHTEDNQYYLDRNWRADSSHSGSIFLECQNSPDFTAFNSILYGHNMGDGSMFADVRKFEDETFFAAHPHIYIVLPGQILRYEVFAAYQAPVDSQVYGLRYDRTETRLKLLQHALDNATCYKEINPQVTDRYLTLSTCTGTGYAKRNVVLARLPMIETEVP